MNLPSIAYPKEALSHFSEVIGKEWLITNGLGSYASSTVLGINTRKYHGLLVAALNPPGNRTVCFSKLDEDVTVENKVIRLGSNEFRDSVYPDGYRLIEQFSINPFPTYIYDLGGIWAKKTIFMPKNTNAVAVIYQIANKTDSEIKIKLFPLLTCRYFHTVLDSAKTPWNFNQTSNNTQFQTTFQHPQATILCRISNGNFKEGINWVNRIYYRDEAMRGEANLDDCFQPGYFELQIPPQTEGEFAVTAAISSAIQEAKASLDSIGNTIDGIKQTFQQELGLREDLMANFYRLHPDVNMNDWLNWILLAADSFIVKNAAERKAVIAGYHWFESWGRDTFISIPGLMLVTGRFRDAKDIFQNFIHYCQVGLIPNLVGDRTGIPLYNTVDGTLWYINAVLQYLKYTGDFGFVKDELWESLQAIIEYHKRGTMFGIHVDDDGLLMHGAGLTWMDAKVGAHEITPRSGKAVEIQALWFNALKTMEKLAQKFEQQDSATIYASMANQASLSFNKKFWNPQQNCLFDSVDTKDADASIRPNQIFAVSLDFSMIEKEKSQKVVDTVSQELATPFGLRTLSLNDPKFVGKCFGDVRSRDAAYHNGTIWPWLLGPYATAYLKVNDYTADARRYALEKLLLPLLTVSIHQGGLGTINEIYDCDPPNEPRGCIAQAWSVAEPLRAYVEDILQVKPKNSAEILGI